MSKKTTRLPNIHGVFLIEHPHQIIDNKTGEGFEDNIDVTSMNNIIIGCDKEDEDDNHLKKFIAKIQIGVDIDNGDKREKNIEKKYPNSWRS